MAGSLETGRTGHRWQDHSETGRTEAGLVTAGRTSHHTLSRTRSPLAGLVTTDRITRGPDGTGHGWQDHSSWQDWSRLAGLVTTGRITRD
jgi:hypothetical protein